MAEWTALAGVIATGVVGLAGIAAAFFAPAWSQERLERRRELRDFRSARRLVAQELYLAHVDTIVHDKPGALPPDALDFFQTSEWDAHKATLSRELADADYEPVRNAY